jgi:polyisoprenyl-teichoic acid--peptidoglycan teichoic acid transferase
VKDPGDRPPRVGLKFALRALLACVLVMVLTGTAVATVALRELDDIFETVRQPGRADIDVPELDDVDPGGPRTFMILGSDAREGADAGMSPRSDTILLARADPDKDAIALMSIPRDLKVEIPGHGEGKINGAFELGGKRGGPRLVVRTVKKLFEDATGENFPITNVMIMDYGAFRRAVNFIGGVYVDIDRDYFNDNSSGENYATIDINPGYQLLKGRDALDYVRYRHTDNDLVRAARQQDFLRQAKNAAGVRKLLASGLGEAKYLIRVFSRYFRVDKSLRSNKQIISMLKLVLYLAGENPKVHEVAFKVHDAPNPQLDSNLYYRDGDLRRTFREFMQVKESDTPRESTPEPAEADADDTARERKQERRARDRRPTEVAGLEDARREGEDQAVLADPKLKIPFYYPTKRLAGSAYSGTEPRIYTIRDERGTKREAYRLVLSRPGRIGEYYGVQGLAWKAPPILDDPDRTIRRGNRRFRLYYDGKRLRLVAWRTKRGVYWISNTLTQTIDEDQMIAIAASLKRLNQ